MNEHEMFEVQEFGLRPLYDAELEDGKIYRIEGHWLGDFTGRLVRRDGLKWKIFRVTRAESGLLPGQEVEIAPGHAQYYHI